MVMPGTFPPPPPHVLDIIALVATNDSRGRIIASIGRRAKVWLATTPDELTHLVARRVPSAVICEFGDRTPPDFAKAVSDLRARRPRLPMIGYCLVEADTSRHIMTAARAGVSALALRGVDDVGAMMNRVIDEAEGDIVSQAVMSALGPAAPAIVRDVLDHCIRHARALPDVGAVADALQLPRRTLAHRLLRAGAPSVGALICWGRLFVAAELLADEGQPVDRVALALEFTTGSALRGMLQRYARMTPKQLRERGGLPYLVATFALQALTRAAIHNNPERDIPLPTQYEPLPAE